MSCDCHANHCIQCSVTQCRNHCSDENYCSLERIQVGTHESDPTMKQCTDCMSFVRSPLPGKPDGGSFFLRGGIGWNRTMGEGIAMGGKQGRKKRNWLPLQLAAAMPLATLALAALAARLILGGKLPESSLPVAAGVIAGLVAFLGALIAALHSGRRKLLCGLGAAGGYALFLLLGNLLFFGVHYGEALPVLLPLAGAGLLGALLGAGRRKKRRYA